MPGILDKLGRASIPTDVAVATTVKTTRAAGILVLEAFDLSKFAVDTPVFFITYKKTVNPVTGEVTITSLVSWKALVNSGANTLTNLTVAPGYTDLGNAIGDFIECVPTSYWENSLIDALQVGLNPDGTFKKTPLQTALGNDGRLVDTLDELTSDSVLSGGIWSLVSGLNGQMTALAAYINGYKNTVAAIASRAFTINKDTYVDILKDPATHVFTVVYIEVTNGATAPVLAANSIRLAKVVTNGSTITSVVQSGQDSLGNPINPIGAIGFSNTNGETYPAIRLKATTNTSLSTSAVSINLVTTDLLVGSGLSRSGSTVVIGNGIKRVKVSGVCIADSMSTDTYLFTRLRLNRGGSLTEFTSQLQRMANGFSSNSHPPFLLDVLPGDIIDFRADIGAGSGTISNGRPQWLQVEAVA